ncbi:hypothetical protein HFP05_14320, partial [Rhodanobacter denitrificans]|nr:hypothetical protein [Rhodanobacter denitrificans]
RLAGSEGGRRGCDDGAAARRLHGRGRAAAGFRWTAGVPGDLPGTRRRLRLVAAVEREQLLRELDAVAQQAGGPHWFVDVRELALRAYFTSEIGMTRAMRYVAIPGRWEGCLPLAPGQPAWGG